MFNRLMAVTTSFSLWLFCIVRVVAYWTSGGPTWRTVAQTALTIGVCLGTVLWLWTIATLADKTRRSNTTITVNMAGTTADPERVRKAIQDVMTRREGRL